MADERASDGDVALNPWIPERHPVTRAVLGKLTEELGELTAALSRCNVQGVHEVEPVTQVANREWVQKETADVLAGISLLIQHLDLDENLIYIRAANKTKHLLKWHAMIARALGLGLTDRSLPKEIELVIPPDIKHAMNERAADYRKAAEKVIEVLSDEFGLFDDENKPFRTPNDRPLLPGNHQRMVSRLEEVLVDGLA